MPKHFRKCGICFRNSITYPNIVIFTASKKIKKIIGYPMKSTLSICQFHFEDHHIRTHGGSKRLTRDAIPVNLPNRRAPTCEHDHIPTGPLNLVSSI